jgi:acetoin utilization protein AcuB
MLVEELMKRQVITVSSWEPLLTAWELCREKRIRHLPVVDNGVLVGILTDRDLREAKPPLTSSQLVQYMQEKQVVEVMKTRVITVHPLDHLDEAIRLFQEHKIGCVPVVAGGVVIGIVTETDLLQALAQLLGVHKPGTYCKVQVPDHPGSLARVSEIISRHNINVNSVLLTPGENAGSQYLSLRIHTIDPRPVLKELEAAGFQILWPRAREN